MVYYGIFLLGRFRNNDKHETLYSEIFFCGTLINRKMNENADSLGSSIYGNIVQDFIKFHLFCQKRKFVCTV